MSGDDAAADVLCCVRVYRELCRISVTTSSARDAPKGQIRFRERGRRRPRRFRRRRRPAAAACTAPAPAPAPVRTRRTRRIAPRGVRHRPPCRPTSRPR